MPHIIVGDLETIPDPQGFAAANRLEGKYWLVVVFPIRIFIRCCAALIPSHHRHAVFDLAHEIASAQAPSDLLPMIGWQHQAIDVYFCRNDSTGQIPSLAGKRLLQCDEQRVSNRHRFKCCCR
jgi:hypothetical protein